MHSIHSTQGSRRNQPAEPTCNAFYTFTKCPPVHNLRRVLHLTVLCNMKHGKYDLYKSSANISVGTSYSWYYKKNNSTIKSKKLTRSASDSTLFSDYNNQISLFEIEKQSKSKKYKKSVSDVGKNSRVKCRPRHIKPVHMEPFTGNFFYGKTLPGYKDIQKSEEKIVYLPDSDVITVSEDYTAESVTTVPTTIDPPDVVKNPLYGCRDTDVQILTPEYSTETTVTKDSQLVSNSCTELRKTMNSSDDDVLASLLKDYKKIMQEWNNTINEHYSTNTYSQKSSSVCRKSNAESFVRSCHSTISCRKRSKFSNYCNYKSYKYPYTTQNYTRYQSSGQNKIQNFARRHLTANFASSFQSLKPIFRKDTLTPSESECLEAIYEDYEKRLERWSDTLSHYSSVIHSVFN